jgi:hypothetical protein
MSARASRWTVMALGRVQAPFQREPAQRQDIGVATMEEKRTTHCRLLNPVTAARHSDSPRRLASV